MRLLNRPGACRWFTSDARIATGIRSAAAVLAMCLAGCTNDAQRTRSENVSATPAPAASRTPASPGERQYLLERVDDAAVGQIYADGFSTLPLSDKILIWHLYQAAIAGRDIFYDQRHRNALEMRAILEQVVAHPRDVDPATLAEVVRYTKLFWINNGSYNNLTARKFVLKCTPEALLAAVKASAAPTERSPGACAARRNVRRPAR
jgi:hypothetical protein